MQRKGHKETFGDDIYVFSLDCRYDTIGWCANDIHMPNIKLYLSNMQFLMWISADTHTIEYYSAKRKECSDAICSNLDGPRDYHTK